jgi:hypothetical protein
MIRRVARSRVMTRLDDTIGRDNHNVGDGKTSIYIAIDKRGMRVPVLGSTTGIGSSMYMAFLIGAS